MVDREFVPCFFTGGYTEAGEMQQFLRKINDRFSYRQCFPNKTKKRKGMPKEISSEFSGLTGDSLIEKVVSILEKHKTDEEYSSCRFLIIEDDLDFRFKNMDEEQKKEDLEATVQKIQKVLPGVKVLFLFACPEIESWFIADWNNGFGCVSEDSPFLSNLKNKTKKMFLHELKLEIDETLLDGCNGNPEEFPEVNEDSVKLSEAIQGFVKTDVPSRIKSNNSSVFSEISAAEDICYSKRRHGSFMLRCIKPEEVKKHCRLYFAGFYEELRKREKE